MPNEMDAPAVGVPLPDDLSTLDEKALTGLRDKISKAFERLNAKAKLTAEELAELGVLADQMDAVRQEQTRIDSEIAEAAERRAELAARMAAETAEAADEDAPEADEATDTPEAEAPSLTVVEATETPTPEDEVDNPNDDESEDDVPDDQPAAVTVGEALAASAGKRGNTKTAPRNIPEDRIQVRPRGNTDITIVASSDTPGVSMGAHLDRDGLLDAIHKRARAMGVSKTGRGDRALVASIEKNNPVNDIRGLRNEADILAAWETAHNPESMVASGGWCAPSETVYDFECQFEEMPDTVDLPTLTANRGGLRVPQPLELADFLAEAGVGAVWTEADDIAAAADGGPVKVCAEIPCPEFEEVRLEAIYTCLKAGNLADRAWPELTARSVDLANIAHAHKMNAAKIAKMLAVATPVAPTLTALSAAEAILSGIEFVIARTRDQYLMGSDQVLEVVLPRWVRNVIRRDLARRSGVAFDQVSNEDIRGYFSDINARVQFVTNWQMLDSAAVAYPATVNALVYPAGAFTLLDGGSLDISVLRDSVLNSTNDHSLLFFEEFWALLSRCASYNVEIPVCPDGSTGAPVDLSCPLA